MSNRFHYHYPQHLDGHYCVHPADLRAVEKKYIESNPGNGHELMEIAGREVAQHILNHYRGIRQVLVFCGCGNNGGDALVAAYYLRRCQIAVHLFVFDEKVSKTEDALTMFDRVKDLPRTVLKHTSDTAKILDWSDHRSILVIDGIFGTGYKPAHSILMSRVYQCIAQLDCPVISVDIPSGIDALTGYRGTIEDETPPRALKATDTITFGVPKTGHFVGEGPAHTGNLYCVDIGIPSWSERRPRTLLITDEHCQQEYAQHLSRDLDTHKGRCGHVVILGGEQSMPGASSLCARAALHTGCGLVTIGARSMLRTQDEIMVKVLQNSKEELDERALNELLEKADCVVVGPGLGRDKITQRIVRTCLDYQGCIVWDADALWALSEMEEFSINASESYMTPHPGEAAMLCHTDVKSVLYNPENTARQIAEKYHTAVVLKSHSTLVAAYSGKKLRMGLSPYPNPEIVSAGVGDVFAGVLSATLTQARGGVWNRWFDMFDVAAKAVNLHSLAGRLATDRLGCAACASDLIDSIGVRKEQN